MVRLDSGELATFVSSLVIGLGADATTADVLASSLVGADLAGHRSHGVALLPTYADRIDKGQIDPTAIPETVREDKNTATVDGGGAFGQLTGRHAIDVGIPRARDSGVATVGIRNGTHLGRIGEWAEQAAAAELAFIAFVANPSSEFVAPPGSSQAKLSTNPIAIGLPSFGAVDYPIVLDMATSQVAFGKIRDYAARDKRLPDEWTTFGGGSVGARDFLEEAGSLLPLGGNTSGYKGFGLATLSELLAGTIGDATVSGQSQASGGNIAGFFLVDPLRFTTVKAIEDRINAFERHVKSAETDPALGFGYGAMSDGLLLPGEGEYRSRVNQRDDGVYVSPEVVEQLNSLARARGVDRSPPWDC